MAKFSLFKLLIFSGIGGVVATFAMIVFSTIGLIHPYNALIHMLNAYQIDSTVDFTVIGNFFDYWNLITFSLISADPDYITPSNIFLLICLAIGCITIAFICKGFLESALATIFYFISMMMISILMAQLTLTQIPTEDYPPGDVASINQMKLSMMKLTFLIPFNRTIQLALTFAYCMVITFIFSFLFHHTRNTNVTSVSLA